MLVEVEEFNWLDDFVDSLSGSSSPSSDATFTFENEEEYLFPVDRGAIFKVTNPAKCYVERLISAFNNYDIPMLYKILGSSCAPDAVFVKHVYRIGQSTSLSQTLFASLDEFCRFLLGWQVFVPDGVFTASSPRTHVNKPPTLLFMSTFTFRGSKLLKEIDLLQTPFEQYDAAFHQQVLLSSLPRMGEFRCIIHGSIAIHANTYGQISKLELFLSDD